MYMSFNMPPPLLPPATGPQQCGRAVFSDIHPSGASDDTMFPMECANPDPTYSTNEKALEYLFFDMASCVQDDTAPMMTP